MSTTTAARVATTNLTYPVNLRPNGSENSEFWTGSEADRTFFVVETKNHLALVLSDTDHRSLYMRGVESMDEIEKEALKNAGLEPFGHKVWTIDREHLTFADDTEQVFEKAAEIDAAERISILEAFVAAARTESERLQVRLNSVEGALRREQGRLEDVRSQHKSDIELISNRLIEECESRSWCAEYDKVVSDLNGNLNIPLREREREFEVTLTVTVRITKTVEALNADSAGDLATEMVSSYDLDGADIDDVEVYEVEES